MKSLSYGYIRVTDERDDEAIRQMEGGLRTLAGAESLRLIKIWYEYQDGYYGTLYELLYELKHARKGYVSARVGHVIVPSLDHLSSHPLVQEQLFRRLGERGVQVWVVGPMLRPVDW